MMYEHLQRPQLDRLLDEVERRRWNVIDELAGLDAESGRIREAIRHLGGAGLDAADVSPPERPVLAPAVVPLPRLPLPHLIEPAPTH
jgi:hypothetical protein